jgi:uncharacterized protein YbaR (Trm112 family)
MEETIQIKCPWCNAVLTVRNQPGIENKSVACPVCKQKSPFLQYKRNAVNNISDDCTQYPGAQVSTAAENNIIGQLICPNSGIAYQLKMGRNVVGRKASNSSADFQLDMADNRRMSREHIVIDVKNVPNQGIVHYISLYKERVNPTKVGSESLVFGDCLILKDGDCIQLPDVTLRFVLPDDDATQLR